MKLRVSRSILIPLVLYPVIWGVSYLVSGNPAVATTITGIVFIVGVFGLLYT